MSWLVKTEVFAYLGGTQVEKIWKEHLGMSKRDGDITYHLGSMMGRAGNRGKWYQVMLIVELQTCSISPETMNIMNCKALKMHMLFHLATGGSSCEAEVLTCMLILKRPSNIAGYIKLIKNRFSCLCWPNTHLKACLNYQGQPQRVMHQSFFQSFDKQELKENPISISTTGNKQKTHITWDCCSSQGYTSGVWLSQKISLGPRLLVAGR